MLIHFEHDSYWTKGMIERAVFGGSSKGSLPMSEGLRDREASFRPTYNAEEQEFLEDLADLWSKTY